MFCSSSRLSSSLRRIAAALGLLLLLAAPAGAATAAKADQPAGLSINLVNTDIASAVQAVAAATGRNFIVDPRVKGTITLQFEKPVPPQQVYLALLAQLRLAGYAVVDHAGVLRVVPEADARLQTTPVGIGNAIPGRGDQIVTQVFRLRNQSAANLLPVLRPLISPNNTISADKSGNALVITEYADNLRRIASIIAGLDQPSNIHVVYLKYANAAELARGLRGVLAADATAGGAAAPGAAATSAIAPTAPVAATGSSAGSSSQEVRFGDLPGDQTVTLPQGGSVYADTAMNALIINAPQPVFHQIEGVIAKLDVRRTQVYIQALIAEVDANNLSSIGVQWQGAAGSAGGNNTLIGGTNFGTAANGNIAALQAAGSSGSLGTALASGAVGLSQGLNIGLLHAVNGHLSIGALASLLQSLQGTNILSAPELMTMNNQEASLLVGENVPVLTGSYTANTSGSGSSGPFQTYQRTDVGLKLKIRPQITAGGDVKLDVYQEVSAVDPATVGSAAGPSFTKRTVQTTVLVDNGQTVALGGLMQNTLSDTTTKVPLLGDIPGLGALFRYHSRGLVKTDLIVFLRPVVVRDAQQAAQVSQPRYDAMQGAQDAARPQPAPGMLAPDQPDLRAVLPAPAASAPRR